MPRKAPICWLGTVPSGSYVRTVNIVIVGGGAAGLFASLLIGRAGHDVVVVEQDMLEPAPDVEAAAASAFRPAAPHIVQPHIVMAKCRELLLQLLPDVYEGLLAAGVEEVPIATQMPTTLADLTAWPGDERLTLLMTRRSTMDWVLQRAVLAEPGVAVRYGVRAMGLLAVPGSPPHVTGVRTEQGDLAADLVVDATGRRSPVDRWLEEIGARPAAIRSAECGVTYYSRHFRLRPKAELPGPATTRIVSFLPEFTVGLGGADNDAMQLAVVPLTADRRFRTLRDPDVFSAVLRTIPAVAPWLDVMDPITRVFPMAGFHNTMRRLVVDGTAVVTGLHTVGDATCATNPTLGRGLSLALSGAVDLLDTITKHQDDPIAQSLAMDGLVAEHVQPFYEDQVSIDAARLAMLRHTILDAPAPAAAPVRSDRVTFSELRTAAPYDPTTFRAFWKVMGLISRPDDVYTDTDVIRRTRTALRHHTTGSPIAQPSREELLTALAPATSWSGGC
jgi:2-polyprenyl-6-methoxyphenol hydroxylase-like FAD-dependent oxidoreductase